MTEKVLTQIDKDGNATVALNRPAVHNAFDPEMGVELILALKDLEADPTVRAVVLMGQGRSFSAGADIENRWVQNNSMFRIQLLKTKQPN